MANFRDFMAPIDARIDASRISDDLTLPDGSTIRGRFLRETVSTGPDGGLVGEGILVTSVVFRCDASAAVRALIEGDIVAHAGTRYRLQRRYPSVLGDHAGRVDLQLGVTE